MPQQVTALLPQINFNAITNTTDYQRELYGDVAVKRSPEWTLSESNPGATLGAYFITEKLSSYWNGERGKGSNLGYLEQ